MLPLGRSIVKSAALVIFCASLACQTAAAEEFNNYLGMKFVAIPEGTFKMGATSETPDVQSDELPQHNVWVQSFQMMPTEVTLAQYKRYIIESSNIEILQDDFMAANSHDNSAPVVFISWNDVRYFIHWLNQNKPENDPGEYMLPTEAEWEYACRAGGDHAYCGGNTPRDVAWYSSKTVGFQQPVAQKQANAFGLYDMSGNVREWVQDCYHETYQGAPADGTAWERNCYMHNAYVTRGGSWEQGQEASRVTDRASAKFNKRDTTIGFRLVRKVSQW